MTRTCTLAHGLVTALVVGGCTIPERGADTSDVEDDGVVRTRKKPSSNPPRVDAAVDASPDAPSPDAAVDGGTSPPPAWTDACAVPGAVVARLRPYGSVDPNDEGATAAIPLPFTFTYFGRAYGSYWVTSNGELGFGDSPGGSAFGQVRCPLPDSYVTKPIAFAYAVDLIGGTVCMATLGTAPQRRLVVTWKDKKFYELDGNGNGQSSVTFGATLHEGTHRLELAVHHVEATSVFFPTQDVLAGAWSVLGVQSGGTGTSFSCREPNAPAGSRFAHTP